MSGNPFYGSARWKQLRKMVLNRHPICQAKGCYSMATDVDHIDGDVANNDMVNLQALCHPCHSAKTVRENRATRPSGKTFKGHDAQGMPIDDAHPWCGVTPSEKSTAFLL